MSASHPIYPHGDLERLGPDLWSVTGSQKSPIPRTMTVYRTATGELVLYSVVALDAARLATLEALGRPTIMVVPHFFHIMDAAFYVARYPQLRVIALADAAARLRKRGVASEPPGTLLDHLDVRSHVVPGLKYGELVLDLPFPGDAAPGGRALLFADSFAGAPTRPKGLMMKLLGAPGGHGTPRIVKFRQLSDRVALRAFFRRLADETDAALLVPAHGSPFRERCVDALAFTADRI